VSGAFNRKPAETWQQYAPLFREYSTAAITPELLAPLTQVESTGYPLASTYWRWRLTWDPFEVYEPGSSGVGMYQMTDAAFAEVRRYCIRRHTVVEYGCSLNWLYSRVVPSHAIELTAVFLDRNLTAVLSHWPNSAASPQRKQELAAVISSLRPRLGQSVGAPRRTRRWGGEPTVPACQSDDAFAPRKRSPAGSRSNRSIRPKNEPALAGGSARHGPCVFDGVTSSKA
jgi:hypothetical protein